MSTILRAAMHGQGHDNLRRALRERLDFKTSGSFSGERRTRGLGPWDSGRLAGDDLEAFRRDMGSITYVVYSYATPIYWETDTASHTVAQKFSPTTTKHQGKLYLLDLSS